MTKKRAAKTTKSAGRRVPVLRVHKQSQRCYGRFSGQEVWFGARTGPATQNRFDAYLAEWLARGRKLEQVRDESLTVRSLAACYLIHLESEHDPAGHRNNGARMKYALDALLKLHGPTPAAPTIRPTGMPSSWCNRNPKAKWMAEKFWIVLASAIFQPPW